MPLKLPKIAEIAKESKMKSTREADDFNLDCLAFWQFWQY
jgi:hypothetical protein